MLYFDKNYSVFLVTEKKIVLQEQNDPQKKAEDRQKAMEELLQDPIFNSDKTTGTGY